jgi:hypothetical protein
MSINDTVEHHLVSRISSLDIDTSKFSADDLDKMKAEFPGQCEDDLARFLVARSGNYDLAADMFRTHLSWLGDTPKPTKESCW